MLVPASDPKQQQQQQQQQLHAYPESIPPQIHFAEQTQGAERCPLVLENPNAPGSGLVLAHSESSVVQGLSSQSIPLVLNDSEGLQTSQSFQVKTGLSLGWPRLVLGAINSQMQSIQFA